MWILEMKRKRYINLEDISIFYIEKKEIIFFCRASRLEQIHIHYETEELAEKAIYQIVRGIQEDAKMVYI
jgi:hypothetical protein